MYTIKAVFDGINFKPIQPIPVTENYEVIITFLEPIKKNPAGIMDYCGKWSNDDFLDIEDIIAERNSFSLGRSTYDDIS